MVYSIILHYSIYKPQDYSKRKLLKYHHTPASWQSSHPRSKQLLVQRKSSEPMSIYQRHPR